MSTERRAAAIVITIVANEGSELYTATVLGPHGQWSAALNPKDARNFVASVMDRVAGDLGVVLCNPLPDLPF